MPWRALPGLCGLIAAVPTSVLAATFSLPIPELTGTFISPTSVNVISPVQFESISDVQLTIRAQGTPEVFERCAVGPDCTRFEHGPSLLARFDREGALPIRLIFGASEPFGLTPTTLSFPISDSAGSFNFFLDGAARLEFWFNGVAFLPEDPVSLIQPPTLEIFDAQLIVTGTPIPEPATAAIVLAGLAMLSRYARRLTIGCS